MNAYYTSLLKDIENKIIDKHYDLAYELICQELDMPYVEKDALEALNTYKDECKLHLNHKIHSLDTNKLYDFIHGDFEEKICAIQMLENMNLRMFHDEVQILLNSDLPDEYKGELIEALMEQKIDDPYEIIKSGLQITFIPSSILPISQDKTIIEACSLFESWYSNEDPSLVQFCTTLFLQHVLSERPFDQEEEDAYVLAKAISRLVFEAMQKSDEWPIFEKKLGLREVEDIQLSIEKRGENND